MLQVNPLNQQLRSWTQSSLVFSFIIFFYPIYKHNKAWKIEPVNIRPKK